MNFTSKYFPGVARGLALLAAVVLAACGGGTGDPADSEVPGGEEPRVERDWSGLTRSLDSFVGEGPSQVRGYSFVLNVDGVREVSRAGGDMSLNAVVPIASSSKAPAAVALLTLVREGRLDLDAPVSRYIGSAIDWPTAKAAITTRMLLNHTSGLPNTSPCLDQTSGTTLKACAEEIATQSLDFTPGRRFGYSATGYQVAGLVAEQITGQSWNTLFRERVTSPLGMSSFSYGEQSNPRVAGGAVSNATDYLRFSQAILDGGAPLLSAEQGQMLRRNQVSGLAVFYSPELPAAQLDGYSYGWWISATANHPGSAGPEISDPGAFGSVPWIDFGKRYTAVLLITGTPDQGLAIWSAARSAILTILGTN